MEFSHDGDLSKGINFNNGAVNKDPCSYTRWNGQFLVSWKTGLPYWVSLLSGPLTVVPNLRGIDSFVCILPSTPVALA